MLRRSLAISVGSICLVGLLAADVRIAHAQTVDELFNVDTLQELRLFIHSKDLAVLRETYQVNTLYPADLVWRNTRVRNVAVRSRGFGSRNPTKLGLHIDFDHYTTGQQFVGLKSLVLKNLWQDGSMVREKVALGLYSRLGQPASRESFGRVFINNVYQGLYAIVEDIDANFLTRTVGENAGYLYEYHWQYYWNASYLGDAVGTYEPFFEARTHEREPDAQLYSPIRDLFREINGPDDAVWRDRVEQAIDLKQFVSMVAIEVFLGEADGLTGAFGMANFGLYRPLNSTRHQVIPWDRDHSMSEDVNGSIFFRTMDNVLFRRAMGFGDLYAHYLDELQRCAESAEQDGWIQNEVARHSSLISAAAHEDTRKQFTNDEYDGETLRVMDYVRLRPAHVRSEVLKARVAR